MTWDREASKPESSLETPCFVMKCVSPQLDWGWCPEEAALLHWKGHKGARQILCCPDLGHLPQAPFLVVGSSSPLTLAFYLSSPSQRLIPSSQPTQTRHHMFEGLDRLGRTCMSRSSWEGFDFNYYLPWLGPSFLTIFCTFWFPQEHLCKNGMFIRSM